MNDILVFLISFLVTLIGLFPLALWVFNKILDRWIFKGK
jgi:hypothetical protein